MAVQVVDDQLPAADPGETSPYTLLVVLHAKPERAEALNELLLAQVVDTRAEPGNVTYQLNRDRAEPTVFYFFEAYTSLEAFRHHLDSPYITSMLRELPPYLTQDVRMTFLKMSSTFA